LIVAQGMASVEFWEYLKTQKLYGFNAKSRPFRVVQRLSGETLERGGLTHQRLRLQALQKLDAIAKEITQAQPPVPAPAEVSSEPEAAPMPSNVGINPSQQGTSFSF
jgi:hypothetical protein